MSLYRRLPTALPIAQAIEGAPALSHLSDLVKKSSAMLGDVRALIPPNLKVHAGPIQDQQWYLLVEGSAAAAKLRQLLPVLQSSLKRQGWQVEQIKIKVMGRSRG